MVFPGIERDLVDLHVDFGAERSYLARNLALLLLSSQCLPCGFEFPTARTAIFSNRRQ